MIFCLKEEDHGYVKSQNIAGFIRHLQSLEKDPFLKKTLENLEKHLENFFYYLEKYYEFLTIQGFCFKY